MPMPREIVCMNNDLLTHSINLMQNFIKNLMQNLMQNCNLYKLLGIRKGSIDCMVYAVG